MYHFIQIRLAVESDVPTILSFIRGLAEYEKLTHQCIATESKLRDTLFGPRPYAEVLIATLDDEPAGFVLFFHSYSTFLAQPGIYLEDLFVQPSHRRHGVGRALMTRLANIAKDRKCGRLEWSVLDWNQSAIDFYIRIGATILPDWRICRMTAPQTESLAQL